MSWLTFREKLLLGAVLLSILVGVIVRQCRPRGNPASPGLALPANAGQN